jgi:3-hydroxybutyrate dehydrogenase
MKPKSAIVTGSTSGIGLAIARRLAQNGCRVMLNGFGADQEIEALQQQIASEYTVDVLYSSADMTQPEQIVAMVETAAKSFGSIDILVNNAGIQHVAPIDDFAPQKWDAIIAINLSAAFHTIRMALPHMKAGKWGRIINVASAHGLVASPYKSAYVASKHGIIGLTKTVALEVAEQGITCNAICPGYVKTPLVEDQIADQAKSRGISQQEVVRDVLLAAQPTKAFVTLNEVSALAAFLSGDEAASITGTAIPIEGGWTAQ